MANKLAWKFPSGVIMRIEAAFVAVIALLVFIGSFFYYEMTFTYPLMFTVIFLVLYVLSSYIIKTVKQTEEHYLAQASHLEITKKNKHGINIVKVPWKHVTRHKLDKTFLGGYLLTKNKKRHPLFFNTRKELNQFEKFIGKVMKK